MTKKRQKVEFRYYEIPEKELVLALLGSEWVRPYGDGIDYLHFHNYMEIGICHNGQGEIILEETKFDFDGGRIVIIPPNLTHTTNCEAGTTAFWEWLYFDIDRVLEDMYSEDAVTLGKVKSRVYESPLYFKEEEQPFISDILKYIMKESQEKGYLHQDCIRGLLRLFVTEILRMQDAEAQMKRREQNTVIIAPAIEYVDTHFREPLRVADLAEACSISESHFRRVFQTTMNMKPLDYINLVRIQKACLMMKKTDDSMEKIAYQCGFENIATFNRNFKRILSTSPYQWKQSAQNYEGKLLNYRISAQKGW